MTKEILITMKGLHEMEDSQGEHVEVMIPGTYFKRGDTHYIKYDEVSEEEEGITENLIKLRPDGMEVIKKGRTKAHMVFESQKKNETYYETAFGTILIGISAIRIMLKETEDEIAMSIDYSLEMNECHVADSRIDIRVCPRQGVCLS